MDAVVSAIGEPAHRALGRNQTTPAARCLAGRDDPLACLIRLWLLQQAVSTTELDEALPGLGLVLRRAGIVAVEHDRASAVIDIRPYAADQRAYWICADLTPGLDGMVTSARPDLVLGVSSASTSLAQLTPREPVETRDGSRHRKRCAEPAPGSARAARSWRPTSTRGRWSWPS